MNVNSNGNNNNLQNSYLALGVFADSGYLFLITYLWENYYGHFCSCFTHWEIEAERKDPAQYQANNKDQNHDYIFFPHS